MAMQSAAPPRPLGRPLERFSTVDALVSVLRDAVLDGLLEPGQAMTEAEIVSAHAVSRPTAKAAIRRLVQERILRQDLNRSAVVAEPSADDVVDLFRVRIPLELEIVREIITARARRQPGLQISPGAYMAVRELQSMIGRDVRAHEFVAADLHFHRELARLAGSERLLNAFDDLGGELHLSMLQSFRFLDRERIGAQHQEILERIETAVQSLERDWEPAKRAMKDHLQSACATIESSLRAR